MNRWLGVASLLGPLLVSGCNRSDSLGTGMVNDLAEPGAFDMAVEAEPDLAVPLDMAVDAATSPDLHVAPDLAPPPDMAKWGPPYKYVLNKVSLPRQVGDYSIDLNGDGKPDNALAGLVVALQQYGIDLQTHVDTGVSFGYDIKLLRLDTVDPLFLKDPAAAARLQTGVATPKPDYSGNGVFAVDVMLPFANYQGMLLNQHYGSIPPAIVRVPVETKLKFTLFGQKSTELYLNGTHLEFDTGIDVKSGAPGLLRGAVHGSIPIRLVVPLMAPSIAAAFNDHIQQAGPKANAILQEFDVGGCVNLDNTQARRDGSIGDCEVSGSATFLAALAPDVEIYDILSYHPSPLNGNPDSFSVGIGFTAVKASFP